MKKPKSALPPQVKFQIALGAIKGENSYSLMGPRGNPVMESFFARFKGENRDLFLEAKDLRELKGVIEERLRYYHHERVHSGLGYKTPMEVWHQALEHASREEARGVQDWVRSSV